MKPEALLVSIRRIRMVEVDGVGACAQIDMIIERAFTPGCSQLEVATFTLFAHKDKTRRGRNPGTEPKPRNRWEAS